MPAVKGYQDGFEYGLKVGRTMMPARLRENDRYVASTEYASKGSPTRAYWLGFRRALRGLS
jgi:hypothetical protein